MRACTKGKRHRWQFLKNVISSTVGHGWARVSKKGLYRCDCGEGKYGPVGHETSEQVRP